MTPRDARAGDGRGSASESSVCEIVAPMRVTFVSKIATAPGAPALVGGYEHALVAALRMAGHSAEIVGPDEWPTLDPAMRVVVDEAALMALANDVDRLAARRVVALVHTPTMPEPAAKADAASLVRATPRELLARLERVIATSEAAAERVRVDCGVAAEAIAVVAPGIDERVRSHGSGGPGCAILSIGALIPNAGHDHLVRALARLFDLDWHLTIVGDTARDGVHARTLTALVDELGVSNHVVFTGEVAPVELESLWRHTDLFAHGAPQQGFALTTAEALRRGVPLAIVAGDDAAKLVSADAGAVCPPGDRDTLSKSLRRLIFDTALRRDMSDSAWKIGQGLHDWPTQARAFVEAIAL